MAAAVNMNMGSIAPHVVEDLLGILRLYSNGSICRTPEDATFSGLFPEITDDSVEFKDCTYDSFHGLSLRLYMPKTASSTATGCRLSVILFIHGGGFCIGSFRNNHAQNTCLRLASGLGAMVVAPDYRLAPEHRLPAAIDDLIGFVEWMRGQASCGDDEWWSRTDFDRVFVFGDSAGGNLAHQLAVRLGTGSPGAAPVRTRGYVLMSPFFAGVARTQSEERKPDGVLNLELADRMWRLSLPQGEDRDHPYANPFGPSSPSLEHVTLDPILVFAGESEILRDRIRDYVEKLNGMRKTIEYSEFEGQSHSFFGGNPYSETGNEVLQVIKHFMAKYT